MILLKWPTNFFRDILADEFRGSTYQVNVYGKKLLVKVTRLGIPLRSFMKAAVGTLLKFPQELNEYNFSWEAPEHQSRVERCKALLGQMNLSSEMKIASVEVSRSLFGDYEIGYAYSLNCPRCLGGVDEVSDWLASALNDMEDEEFEQVRVEHVWRPFE